MSNRRFEIYQYRQIIFRLRPGESIRAISQAKLADRKKIRQVQRTAIDQRWLNWFTGQIASKVHNLPRNLRQT